MSSAHSREIERIYRQHPLRLSTLLERVLRERTTLDGLTEADLARDRSGAVTDQNNVGGPAAVVRLGREAGITRRSHVLDLGCGLGGPARVLADRFGCRVTGIDLSPDRVRAARTLTRLVSLSHLVSIRHGDALRAHVPKQTYDVIWGQDAWMHVPSLERLIIRWAPALRPQGRLVVQDSCLRRAPANRAEAALANRLERDWSGTLWPASKWLGCLEPAGLQPIAFRRSSRTLIAHFSRLIAAASRSGVHRPARETRSWDAARVAADAGLLAYFTLVAVRPRGHRG